MKMWRRNPDHERLLVSVLMPVYNGARFLVATFETIEAQTYENLEVVVYDDASQDSSWEIVCDAALRSRLPYRISRGLTNFGASFALSRCIATTSERSHYLLHFAQDDLLPDPETVSRLVRRQRKSGAVVVQMVARKVDEAGDLIPGRIAPVFLPSSLAARTAVLLSSNPVVGIGALALKSAAVEDALVRENALCQDWEQFIHYGLSGRIVTEYGVSSWYRLHRASLSKSAAAGQQALEEAAMLRRTTGLAHARIECGAFGGIKWRLVRAAADRARRAALRRENSPAEEGTGDDLVTRSQTMPRSTGMERMGLVRAYRLREELANRYWTVRVTLGFLRDLTFGAPGGVPR